MIKILKHRINLTNTQDIELHEEATILSVQTQGPNIYLWAEEDTTKPLVTSTFTVLGTGEEITDTREYLGTVVTSTGYVWHIYVD